MQSISTTIDAATGCLPPELCRLTAAYLIEKPHSWTPVSTVRIDRRSETETGIDGADRLYPFIWRTLVSSVGFDTGHLNWTVDFDLTSACGWIAVGVTASTTNSDSGGDKNRRNFSDVAKSDDWLIMPLFPFLRDEVGVVKTANNGTTSDLFRFPKQIQHFRIDIAADPATGDINARIRRTPFISTDGFEIDRSISLINASTVGRPDLRLLRPCIAVPGSASVVVRSGLVR